MLGASRIMGTSVHPTGLIIQILVSPHLQILAIQIGVLIIGQSVSILVGKGKHQLKGGGLLKE